MKSIALLSLIVAAFGSSVAWADEASLAAWPPRRGDVIIGFQAARGQGSDINLFVNLGPATAWRDRADGWQAVAALGDELSAHFGAGWFGRGDLWFGALANRTNLKTDPVTEGDPPRTFYLSRLASQPGKSTPWTGLGDFVLGSAATFVGGQYEMLATLKARPSGVALLSFEEIVAWQNGWTYWNPLDARGQQIAYRRFPGGIQQRFGQPTPGPVYLDIQRIAPGDETGRVVFTVAIDSTGRLSVGRGPLP